MIIRVNSNSLKLYCIAIRNLNIGKSQWLDSECAWTFNESSILYSFEQQVTSEVPQIKSKTST